MIIPPGPQIPWTALQSSFTLELFPPAVGDQVGFSLLGIDYDSNVLEGLGCIENAPWTGLGLQAMTFVQQGHSAARKLGAYLVPYKSGA